MAASASRECFIGTRGHGAKEIPPEVRSGTPSRLRTDGRVGTSDPASAGATDRGPAGTGRGKPCAGRLGPGASSGRIRVRRCLPGCSQDQRAALEAKGKRDWGEGSSLGSRLCTEWLEGGGGLGNITTL